MGERGGVGRMGEIIIGGRGVEGGLPLGDWIKVVSGESVGGRGGWGEG
jgi:hypothetical protein